MLPWIIAFVALDLVVTVLVVRYFLAKRAAALGDGNITADSGHAIPDLGKLREYTDAIHPRIGEIVRANWSGDAMSLPGVLGLALEEADREARNRNLTIERGMLKRLVGSSLAKHGVASGSQLREALKQVA